MDEAFRSVPSQVVRAGGDSFTMSTGSPQSLALSTIETIREFKKPWE
jgi:hypothetical protein